MKKRLLALVIAVLMLVGNAVPCLAAEAAINPAAAAINPAPVDPAAATAGGYVLAGSCTTSLKGSSKNRITNVTVAASRLNGLVIQPGQAVSISTAILPRTAENGYKMAGVYSGGKTVLGYGGGICQVSSTLYNAAMNAGLSVAQRFPHSMPVSYLPLGQDAAISWGSKDLIITNPYDTPVMLSAAVDGKTISTAVFVSNASLAGRSYRFYAIKTGGLSATSYRDCYLNGQLVGTEVVANSKYAPHG